MVHRTGQKAWRSLQLVPILIAALLISTLSAAPATAFSYDRSKIDAAFLAEVLASPKADYSVIVRATPKKTNDHVDRARKAIQANNGKAKFALGIVGGAAASLKGSDLLNLTHHQEIDYVFRDVTFHAAFDPVTGASKVTGAGLQEIGVPATWTQYGVTGRGVTVAVVDSGIYSHQDLAGRVKAGIDFTLATPTVVTGTGVGDPGGHGTHVAGLIAGDGTASGGTYTGVAPNASLVDVRVIDATGSSNTSLVLRGLQWILNNRNTYGIKVVNMSLGATPTGSYRADPLATAAEVLTFAGINVVVSAGNAGPLASTITTPATDPYVLSVGAVDDMGTSTVSDDTIATFSSRGPTAFDGISKPDVVAPGRKMISLRSPGSTLDTLYLDRRITATGSLTPDYFVMSGTSMAAPVVAGTLALMLERDAALTPKQAKKRLRATATPLPTYARADQGAGVINVASAVGSLPMIAEATPNRVSDSFAKDMRRFIQGQPIVWKDKTYNGGHDALNIIWDNVTWTNITWDNITWDNIDWEAFTWTNITWDNITWDSITWESVPSLSVGALSYWDMED